LSLNIDYFLYVSMKAFLCISLSYWSPIFLNKFWILVLLASIKPLTLCAVSTYGLFLLKAIWIDAGPQSIKLANFFYRTLCKDLWIWVASTSPWIILRIDIYLPFFVGALTIMLLGCKSLLITSRTVVFLIFDVCF